MLISVSEFATADALHVCCQTSLTDDVGLGMGGLRVLCRPRYHGHQLPTVQYTLCQRGLRPFA